MNVVESTALGRRFGHTWALRDCSLALPEGQLVAVVGPNGAGKSTLLNLVVGLIAPTVGDVHVLGGEVAGSTAALNGIAFVAQDMALPRSLSANDLVHLTKNLNLQFDDEYAHQRLRDLHIDPKAKAGKLSGGQQAQLSLSLALARRPRLLVLDEPTASLDPLARHDFMATVMTAMVEDGVSVVLSSHMIAELERVADYLLLISHGRVRVDGPVEEILANHRLLTGPVTLAANTPGEVIESNMAGEQMHQLVRLSRSSTPPEAFESRPVGLEELTLAYLRDTNSETRTLTGVPR